MAVSAAQIRDWLYFQALPLWSHAGLDREAGGFTEALTLDGRPIFDQPKRLRVQARQVYVYSHAHLLGWTPPDGGPTALDAARAGFDFMTTRYWREPRQAFAFAVARRGEPADERIETYEQAFALYALAWYFRASGKDDARMWADRVISGLDRLADPAHGGWHENPAHDLPRRQNPHMHLLEAFLAWYTATGEDAWLERARRLVTLFRTRLFDPGTGTLGEFFAADWSRAPSTAGKIVEPGHHYEWTWLLYRYAAASGDDTGAEAFALYRFAETHGTDRDPGAASGLAYDSVLRHGTSLDENKRLWCQCEAIKAQLARIEADAPDRADAEERLETLLERLFTLYLAPGHGNWQDHLDRNGRGFATNAPASSLYHLFLALTEVLRVRDGDPGA